MNRIKKMLVVFAFSLMSMAAVLPVYAQSSYAVEEVVPYIEEVIEYKYRVYNGVLQYRRWNATRGYWIDATWLNV